jgi:hypothetical protein
VLWYAGYTTTLNATIGFNYTGTKNFKTYYSGAYLLDIYNQTKAYPNNNVYNVTTNTIIYSNIDNQTIILSSSDALIIKSLSCTYSGSGDWNVNVSDNCTISTDTIVYGIFNLYGINGVFNLNANLTATGFIKENSLNSVFARLNGQRFIIG